MKGSAFSIVVAMVAAAALTVSGCGGGGGDARLPINGISGPLGGSGVSQLSPSVVEPPQEYYANLAGPTDPVQTGWVKSLYLTLPSLSSGAGPYQNSSIRTWADEIFNGVNQRRSQSGIRSLVRNPHLDALAQAHSRDMALRDFFAHTNPEGMSFLQRLQAVNGPSFNHLAENAAKGQESTTEVVSQWASSPGHSKNMLNGNYAHAGVGVYLDPSDAKMPMHITMVFVEFLEDPFQYEGWIEPGGQL
ncbi:MAG TPA: CAP domain-containing protein [Firmicutes bacterium]|nr:CAP domain-containing protein [Bacillota bacterium]